METFEIFLIEKLYTLPFTVMGTRLTYCFLPFFFLFFFSFLAKQELVLYNRAKKFLESRITEPSSSLCFAGIASCAEICFRGYMMWTECGL